MTDMTDKEGNLKHQKTRNNDAPVRRSVVSEEGINNFFDKVIVNATKAVNVEGFRIINVSILCKIVGLMSRMSTKGVLYL